MIDEENTQIETTNIEVNLEIDPARLCFGLSRIGYTPPTALCDILDNSIRAKAKNIYILIVKERPELGDKKKDNVREYVVIDDGDGMDEDGLKEALKLGSSGVNYGGDSLSKFGLGLKSAAFSQGEELQVISSNGNTPFIKYVVSLPKIKEKQKYFAENVPLSEEDKKLVQDYLSDEKGTIVRIGQVRKGNHPSVRMTHEELMTKAGVIYYYFIKGGLQIFIDGAKIEGLDILFTDEANANGNLDEHSWDGKEVRWIKKLEEITLDVEANVKAEIEVTQLPHPPTFELEGRGQQKATRDKYKIEAGNYGYFIYRNKRLISWADRLDGIVPLAQDQDLYSFRGRILINDSADDAFNIDVKKCTIKLSDEAYESIDLLSSDFLRKSRKAWGRAKQLKKERENEDPNVTANEIASEFEPPEQLPGEPLLTPTEEAEVARREREVADEMREKIRKVAAQVKSAEQGQPVTTDQINVADFEAVLKGDTNPSAKKIFRVIAVEDNALWEPYFDTDEGVCVRINKLHKFARQIYEENSANTDLQILFELSLLQIAEAEIYLQKKKLDYPREKVEEMTAEFRRAVSDFLATMCRKLGDKLPPNN